VSPTARARLVLSLDETDCSIRLNTAHFGQPSAHIPPAWLRSCEPYLLESANRKCVAFISICTLVKSREVWFATECTLWLWLRTYHKGSSLGSVSVPAASKMKCHDIIVAWGSRQDITRVGCSVHVPFALFVDVELASTVICGNDPSVEYEKLP
jgi:hypothetical protein